MSSAEKYGQPSPESLPTEKLQQVNDAGQKLARNGTVQQAELGNTVPAPSPAVKYGGGGGNSMEKELPPPTRTR